MPSAKAVATEVGKFGLIFLIVGITQTLLPNAGKLVIELEVAKIAFVLSLYYLVSFAFSRFRGG